MVEENNNIKLNITNYEPNEKYIIKIQSYYRGYNCRKNRLPNILYQVKNFLEKKNIKISTTSKDGRINSCIDENSIIEIIKNNKFKIYVPEIRNWYDILLYDNVYKWIPINIKITTTITSDNTGNYAMCVYAYTDEKLDLYKSYSNGKMTNILLDKLEKKKFNKNYMKDYYFLVINKNDTKEIIINSVKGLNALTSNINNLPFQVKWNKNKEYSYKKIKTFIDKFLETQQKTKESWKEIYLSKIRDLKI